MGAVVTEAVMEWGGSTANQCGVLYFIDKCLCCFRLLLAHSYPSKTSRGWNSFL